jgi:hypothetical protein
MNTPGLLDGVVHRAVGLVALGAGNAAAGLEIDLNVEPLLVGLEFGVRRYRAAVLAADQGQGPTGAQVRVLDYRSTRRTIECTAGAEGWLHTGQTKGW